MNHFFLSRDERVQHWKIFRDSLKELSDIEALNAVAHYWAQAPIMKRAYDDMDFSDWPSPWEMVHKGDWCQSSVAIGMEFTLRLAGWDANRLELITITDYDISEQKMILKIDESLVLNYTVGEVEEYPTTNHLIMISFRHDGKRYFETTK